MNPPQSGPASAAGSERQDSPRDPDAQRDPRIIGNGRDPGRPRDPGRASGGVLRARPLSAQTFHGSDPDTVAASTICDVSPTRCQARTRLYRDGRLELEGFPVAEISDHLADEAVTIWLDLRDPDHADLAVLSEEFGLHPLAVEDARSLTATAPTCS